MTGSQRDRTLLDACLGTTSVRILSFLTIQEAKLWSYTSKAFYEKVTSNLPDAIRWIKSEGYYPALGDELVWQRHLSLELNKVAKAIQFISLVSDDLVHGWSLLGGTREPSACLGPTQRLDGLDVSQIGTSIRLPRPIFMGLEWTLCAWTYFVNGQPQRENFVQPEGWIPGEHALVSSPADDQHVFYSVGRGGWLGCYCMDLHGAGYRENLCILDPNYGTGFFSSQYSLQYLPDGWHFIAAVGSRWRLGMGWNAGPENGNGSTRYYVDGELAGSTPFNLQEPVQYIGNVSGNGAMDEQTQPWGKIADFRIFSRALTQDELKMIMAEPVLD